MLIPLSRDEEDINDLYNDDFFWIHERGVDFIFIFLFLHLLRKLFLNSYIKEQEIAWKSGSFLFLIIHVIIFLGLVLCCTHLSNVTLSIAAGILHTITLKKTKIYWIIFTDKTLNTDTIIRLMYLHYVVALYSIYLSFIHAIDMHYDWKNEIFFNGIDIELNWLDYCLKNELNSIIYLLILFFIFSYFIYHDNEALSYEIFMWGDIGIINDVRFYGVAPHWYFRSYMGWLIICPHHYWGIFGLVFFLLIFFFQPNLKDKNILNKKCFFLKIKNLKLNNEYNFWNLFFFNIFLLSLLYTSSCLPFGRFYNRLNGNYILLLSYYYVFCYLIFSKKN
jgi:quinol-cytochrome oxidoreductase complex cytochrome b subunit